MEDFQINDPEEMKISSESSWLCRLFQQHGLKIDEKQKIIRNLVNDHKQKRNLNNG